VAHVNKMVRSIEAVGQVALEDSILIPTGVLSTADIANPSVSAGDATPTNVCLCIAATAGALCSGTTRMSTALDKGGDEYACPSQSPDRPAQSVPC